MPETPQEERYRPYWEAIRRRVCAVCLDSADDGSCGLVKDRSCPIERHLPRLIDALTSVRSRRMDEYVSALDAQICSQCREREGNGGCRLRDHGECALAIYLPLVVDAMEEAGA